MVGGMLACMRSISFFSPLSTLAICIFSAGCASSSSAPPAGHACTEIGCEQGVRLSFVYRDAGAYVFAIDVDGVKSSCTTSLPLPTDGARACTAEGIDLGLSGSQLPAEQQSIEGLRFATTEAKNISVRVTKDGALLDETSFAVSYRVAPGPNGPDCDPPQCKQASHTF